MNRIFLYGGVGVVCVVASFLLLIQHSRASSFPAYDHIVIVMEENHSYSDIIGSSSAPYINSLANGGALFTNSFGISHPSQPNYFAIYSGSTQGTSDDNAYFFPSVPSLGGRMASSGISFAGYVEHPDTDFNHNPWESFGDSAYVGRDFATFPTDFTQLPKVSFVIPNVFHDMHDLGAVNAADTWLQANMNAYAVWAKTHNSLLIVQWDEDNDAGNNQIATIFYGDHVITGQYNELINHYSVLRTIEDMLGLAPLANSATATAITDVWSASTSTPDTQAPSVPAGLVASTVSNSQINLSWTASTDNVGVTGYKVYRNGVQVGTTVGASYSDTGLTASTTYSYKIAAYDAAGNISAQSSVASATTQAGQVLTMLNIRVAAGTDDAEEQKATGTMYVSSSDLELTEDPEGWGATNYTQVVGMRFAGVQIPKGATVTNAYIQFTNKENWSNATTITFQAQNADTAATFSSAASNVSSRPRTTASVAWSPAPWTTVGSAGTSQQTPNLSPILQEVINRAGWVSGNSLAVIVNGTGHRDVYAYDGDPTKAPLLHIEYTTGSVATTTPDTTAPSTPLGLSGSAVSTSQINLSWSDSTDNVGVTGYKVYRNAVQIATTSSASYSDSGLAASTVYSYTVAAFDLANNVSGQSAAVGAITQATPPTNIAVGDRIGTTANLNIRQGASPSAIKIGTQSVGTQGVVVAGPVSAGGYVWWQVSYDSGLTGWGIANYMTKLFSTSTVGFVDTSRNLF